MRVYVIVGLMLVLYLLPWVVNPGASLSPNAYDLAEWASLHPAVREASLPLLTTFMLRLPLACLALVVAWTGRCSLIRVMVVLILSVAVLRPDFFRALGDPNYQQQAALALIALIGSGIGLSGALPSYRRWVAAAAALIGAAASLVGLVQGYDLMRGFNLPTQIGLGGAMLAVLFVIAAGAAAANQTGQR